MGSDSECSSCGIKIKKEDTICSDCSFLADMSGQTEEKTDLDWLNENNTGDTENQELTSDIDDLLSTNVSEDATESLFSDMDDLFDDIIEDTDADIDVSSFLDDMISSGEAKTEKQSMFDNIKFKFGFSLFTQLFYWTIIFVVLAFFSIEIINPQFNVDFLLSDDFTINPIGFLYGWISFLAMGWFNSYKLRQLSIQPKLYMGLIFVLSNYVFILIVSNIIESIFLTNLIDMVFIMYFNQSSNIFLSTFLTGGWLSYYAGYQYLWKSIYNVTPISKRDPSLIEV